MDDIMKGPIELGLTRLQDQQRREVASREGRIRMELRGDQRPVPRAVAR